MHNSKNYVFLIYGVGMKDSKIHNAISNCVKYLSSTAFTIKVFSQEGIISNEAAYACAYSRKH